MFRVTSRLSNVRTLRTTASRMSKERTTRMRLAHLPRSWQSSNVVISYDERACTLVVAMRSRIDRRDRQTKSSHHFALGFAHARTIARPHVVEPRDVQDAV